DAGRLAVLGVGDRDVRQVQRRFLLHDTAGIARLGSGVPLDEVNALNDDAALLGENLRNRPGLALVTPGQNDDVVAFLDLGCHQRTSGAREMIFMNFLPRSSRVTGPKIRVPIGSPCLLMSTAALRSKRMAVPSGRRSSLAVRTTTARW